MASVMKLCAVAPARPTPKRAALLAPNLAATLSYALGWVTGIIFLILARDDEFVRFHALQSIIVFGAVTVVMVLLGFVPVVGGMLNAVIAFAAFVFWVVMMSRAYLECRSLGPQCCYNH